MSLSGDYDMLPSPIHEPIPIRADERGQLRIGDTRILLDVVVYSFWLGHTPEMIISQYPSLSLDEVYLAIGYYLRHRETIDTYLRKREAESKPPQTNNPLC
jgi:uncharacterized protein (DUF433 family)